MRDSVRWPLSRTTSSRIRVYLLFVLAVQRNGRPLFCSVPEFAQKNLGVTKTRGFLHPEQHVLNAIQNSLCRAVLPRGGRWARRARNCLRVSRVWGTTC